MSYSYSYGSLKTHNQPSEKRHTYTAPRPSPLDLSFSLELVLSNFYLALGSQMEGNTWGTREMLTITTPQVPVSQILIRSHFPTALSHTAALCPLKEPSQALTLILPRQPPPSPPSNRSHGPIARGTYSLVQKRCLADRKCADRQARGLDMWRSIVSTTHTPVKRGVDGRVKVGYLACTADDLIGSLLLGMKERVRQRGLTQLRVRRGKV